MAAKLILAAPDAGWEGEEEAMKDSFGREITYLRVSVTDRCNLRCRYCMPRPLPHLPGGDLLDYEEMLQVCGAAARLGIRAFRVTGGEPLVRRGCVDFLRELKALPGVSRVLLTTNGTLLKEALPALAAAGVDGVNISLDTLDPVEYRRITGQDLLPQVLQGLEQAVFAGLQVKCNCVLPAQAEPGELERLAALAASFPVDVRFIERMPMGGEAVPSLAGPQVIQLLKRQYPDLAEDAAPGGCGPAAYFCSERLQGRIGLIQGVSHNFCGSCNRLRLTSTGQLKSCLFQEQGVEIRPLLRRGCTERELEEAIRRGVAEKPREKSGAGSRQPMNRIGG